MIDAQRYRREGYLLVKGLAQPQALQDCLDEFRAAFDAMAARFGIAPTAAATLPEMSRVMVSLFRADMAAYLAAAKLVQHSVALHRLGCDPAIMAALKAIGLDLPIISTRPFLFIMADALKVPGGYHKTPPHQDWRSVQGSLDGVVVWMPFAPVSRDSYPLEVLPGSHRTGLLPTDDAAFGHQVAPDQALGEFVPLDLELGDAVIFSNFLVHRTGEQGVAEQVRIAASFRYNNVLEETFVERRYPNPYIYRPDLTMLTEGFATQERLTAFFGEPPAQAAE